MDSEHFERQMNFIVDQQAKIVVDIDRLYEAQVLTEQRLSETNDVVTRLAYVTKEGFKDLGAKIDALVDRHIALEDYERRKEDDISAKLNSLADSQIALSESQKRTDERLDRLAATVDRFLSNRRNGH